MKQRISLYPKSKDLSKPWFVEYTNPNGGRPLKKYVPDIPLLADRQAAADKIIDQLQQELKPYTLVNGSVPKWLEEAVEIRCQGKRRKTVEGYESKLRRFLEWYRENGVQQLNEQSGAAYLRWLSKKHKVVHSTTLNRYRQQTKSFFDDLIEAGLTSINPFKSTKRLRESQSTKTWFREDLQLKLLDLISQRDMQLYLACLVQFYCFIRPGEELRNLRISDIMDQNMKLRKFRIECTHAKVGMFRFVPIPEDLWSLLESYIAGYPSHYYLFGHGRYPSAKQIGIHSLYDRHLWYMQYFDLPKGYTFYSWKNTGAVMMYRNGVKMKYISLLMGHTDMEITDRYFKSLGIDDVMDDVEINYPKIGHRFSLQLASDQA